MENLTTEKFDPGQYSDSYAKELEKLIEAKSKGQEIVPKQEEKEPEGTTDIIEALKASLKVKGKSSTSAAAKAKGKLESRSSVHTREEQQRLLTPHEYTGEALSVRYQNCISCHRRTEFTCVKCGYCYSCHWKREQVEKIELRDNLKDFYVSLSKPTDDEDKKQKLEQYEAKDNEPEKWGTLDVLGQPAEPICTYYRCHHKFSVHGSRRCRCKHPINKTLGIQIRYL